MLNKFTMQMFQHNLLKSTSESLSTMNFCRTLLLSLKIGSQILKFTVLVFYSFCPKSVEAEMTQIFHKSLVKQQTSTHVICLILSCCQQNIECGFLSGRSLPVTFRLSSLMYTMHVIQCHFPVFTLFLS